MFEEKRDTYLVRALTLLKGKNLAWKSLIEISWSH